MLAGFAGIASAADGAPFHLVAASSDAATVAPGESAIFLVDVVSDDAVLAHTANLTLEGLPADWTYTRDPAGSFQVPAGGNATLTLSVRPPDAAPAGGPHAITLVVYEEGALTPSEQPPRATLTFNVTVEQPPAPTTTSPDEPAPPRLTLAARDVAGRPNASVHGDLTLLSDDPRRLYAFIDISGPASWRPTIAPPAERALFTGEPQKVSLYATIPAWAQNGTEQTFTVTVRLDGFDDVFEVPWTVTADGEPVTQSTGATTAPSGSTTTGNGTQDGADGSADAPPTPAPLPGLRIDIARTVVEARLGGVGENTVVVDNTGGAPLTVRLEGSAHATWGEFRFDAATFEIPAGARRSVDFSFDVPSDILPQKVTGVSVTVRAADDPTFFRSTQFDVEVLDALPALPPTDEDAAAATLDGGITVSAPAAWGVAAGLGTVGAGALVLARRPWREKLLWGAAGLYTRLARPDVLGHDEREKLYRIVEQHPGTHFHALQRQLGWNTGTLTYHLRVLERHGFVVSRRDGLYRRFYVTGAAPRKETFEGPSGLRADVLEAIRNQHGMSQTDLALALGANKQTVNYHVKALERAGMIRVEKKGRETFLYPSDAPATSGSEPARA